MGVLTSINHTPYSISDAFKTAAKDTIHYANEVRKDTEGMSSLVKLSIHVIIGTSVIIGRPVTPLLLNFLKPVDTHYDVSSIIPALNELANCNEPAGTIGSWRDRMFAIGGVGALVCFLSDVAVINLANISAKIGSLKVFGLAGALLQKTPFTFVGDVIRNTPLYTIIGNITLGFFVAGFVLNTLDLGKHIFAFAKEQKSLSGSIKSIVTAPFKHENKQRVISFTASLLKTAYFGLSLIGITNPWMVALCGLAVTVSLVSMLYGAYVKRHHDTTVDDAPVKPSHPIEEPIVDLIDNDNETTINDFPVLPPSQNDEANRIAS